MTKLGLTLNEAKTSVRNARQEHFDFLGYTFGPEYFRKDGHWYLGASPSRKSVQRLKAKVNDLLVPGEMRTWPDVRNRFNRLLRGWSTYFGYGSRLSAYRAIDNHLSERVRNFSGFFWEAGIHLKHPAFTNVNALVTGRPLERPALRPQSD